LAEALSSSCVQRSKDFPTDMTDGMANSRVPLPELAGGTVAERQGQYFARQLSLPPQSQCRKPEQ
jgi:hypothetical protein